MQKVIILFGKPGAGKGTRLGEFLKGKEDLFEVLHGPIGTEECFNCIVTAKIGVVLECDQNTDHGQVAEDQRENHCGDHEGDQCTVLLDPGAQSIRRILLISGFE